MRNIFAIAGNVLKVAFKKKGNLIVYFLFPVLCILVSISMYSNSGSGTVRIAVHDNDKSTLSSDVVNMLKRNDKFKITMLSQNDIKSSIINQKDDCALIIPQGFQDSIYNGDVKNLQLMSIKGQSVTLWVETYVNYYIANLLDISKAAGGNKEMFNKIYNGYKKQDIKLTVKTIKDKYQGQAVTQQGMGLFILFILVGATTTANFILKEKHQRTYYRTFCAPVNSGIYIAGNILANLVIICIQVLFTIFLTRYALHIDTSMSDIELFTILMDFGLVSTAFGILLVAFSKNMRQSSYLSNLIITPTCMLSGCFWPSFIMPDLLQKVASFLPQTWVLDAITKSQSGAGFIGILPDLGIIFAFALAFLLIGIYKLRINDNVADFA